MTNCIRNQVFRVLAAAVLATLLLDTANPIKAPEAPANFIIHPVAKPVPEISFTDGANRVLTLKDFMGKTLLLNIWATWCGPCRKEMPTLDRLQARLGSERFQVVALSIDRAGPSAIQKFYAEIGIRHLALYIDATARASSNLGLIGLPGTLLINAQGQEVGRLIGPAEWDSPEMIAFLEAQISQASARPVNKLQSTEQEKEASR